MCNAVSTRAILQSSKGSLILFLLTLLEDQKKPLATAFLAPIPTRTRACAHKPTSRMQRRGIQSFVWRNAAEPSSQPLQGIQIVTCTSSGASDGDLVSLSSKRRLPNNGEAMAILPESGSSSDRGEGSGAIGNEPTMGGNAWGAQASHVVVEDTRANSNTVVDDSIRSMTVRGQDVVSSVEGTVPMDAGEWESAGAPWTEFEDWLLQDTYSRYVIGSGKHVLWRRMVREVPELLDRTPQEARQRWLTLTGRLRGTAGGVARVGERVPGSPPLESFYLQPPVLEQWEEIADGDGMGSFRGNVFGQRGLADGTVVTTAPIDASGRRLQDQYVVTQCGVVYELGESRRDDLVEKASTNMLMFAPVTAAAVSAALYALTVLSHHVQVEVFVI